MKLVLHAGAIALLASTNAGAQCKLDGYDSSPPEKLGDQVYEDDGAVSFWYFSDFDKAPEKAVVWNYIENTSTKNLSVTWPKASIYISYLNPLPPGKATCNRYVGRGVSAMVDPDAPITFGNFNKTQNASVYVAQATVEAEPTKFSSIIASSYVDSTGEIKDFAAEFVFSVQSGKIVDMSLNVPGDLYTGLSNIESFWSPSAIEKYYIAAKMQGNEAAVLKWSELNADASFGSFIKQVGSDSGALFTQGTLKSFGLGQYVKAIQPTEMVVFNGDKQPIASGKVSLPVIAE